MNLQAAEDFIVNELRRGLSPTLYYHGLHHTLDVAAVALKLAAAEGVTDAEALALLRIAALYHDAGFLHSYQGHEDEGCALARATLPGFGFTPAQIEQICGLITATKYPQEPRNHLEQIICDADLDYLGRPDFVPISTSLFDELTARQLIADEHAWFQLQARFLASHHFWTRTAVARRAAPKQARLDHILALLANWPAPGETA
ncbi:HD domain-containing protein [Hymenobacter properus]|uniref:HD domain-containing protein n=1 Tax=Hymenobacter properus TaxID=2791026 RepID=A0A931FJ30_9BACT|nr:HD domain-containing protein [Hymenobacter properus]MBF9141433.1 HD domain-containing protein [Hymenobacter properus]MBR7720242.1 HD domain-containing protein [Microvirga sp. SRT04]